MVMNEWSRSTLLERLAEKHEKVEVCEDWRKLQWKGEGEEQSVAYLLEDDRGLSKEEASLIKRLIVKCHKTNSTLVILCQSLLDRRLMELVEWVDEVILTSDPHNRECLRELAKCSGLSRKTITRAQRGFSMLGAKSQLVIQSQLENVYLSTRQGQDVNIEYLHNDNDEEKENAGVNREEVIAAAEGADPSVDQSWLVRKLCKILPGMPMEREYVVSLADDDGTVLRMPILEYARCANDRDAEPSENVIRTHLRLLRDRRFPVFAVSNLKLNQMEGPLMSLNPSSKSCHVENWLSIV